MTKFDVNHPKSRIPVTFYNILFTTFTFTFITTWSQYFVAGLPSGKVEHILAPTRGYITNTTVDAKIIHSYHSRAIRPLLPNFGIQIPAPLTLTAETSLLDLLFAADNLYRFVFDINHKRYHCMLQLRLVQTYYAEHGQQKNLSSAPKLEQQIPPETSNSSKSPFQRREANFRYPGDDDSRKAMNFLQAADQMLRRFNETCQDIAGPFRNIDAVLGLHIDEDRILPTEVVQLPAPEAEVAGSMPPTLFGP